MGWNCVQLHASGRLKIWFGHNFLLGCPIVDAPELHFGGSFQGYPSWPYLAHPNTRPKYCIWVPIWACLTFVSIGPRTKNLHSAISKKGVFMKHPYVLPPSPSSPPPRCRPWSKCVWPRSDEATPLWIRTLVRRLIFSLSLWSSALASA